MAQRPLSGAVVLTGASGYVGTFVAQELLARSQVSIFSLARSPHPQIAVSSRFQELSLGTLKDADKSLPIRGIIHCAALASPVACELDPEGAFESNVALTRELALLARRLEAPLMTLSTDMVFDGLEVVPEAGISEAFAPVPLSVYARTKVEAERITLHASPRNVVLRVGLVYGPALPHRSSFLQWLEQRGSQGQDIPLFTDEWRTPIFVGDLVRVLLWCLESNPTGVLHSGGPQRLSRLEFASAVVPHYQSLFRPVLREEVALDPPRPRDVSLNSDRLWGLSGITPVGPADFGRFMGEQKTR